MFLDDLSKLLDERRRLSSATSPDQVQGELRAFAGEVAASVAGGPQPDQLKAAWQRLKSAHDRFSSSVNSVAAVDQKIQDLLSKHVSALGTLAGFQ